MSGTIDAIKLLKQDHDKLKTIMETLSDTTERAIKTRAELLAKMQAELTVHEAIEEEIFYPVLREHPKAKDIVLEGYEEHHAVDLLMAELEAVPVDSETWGAKFNVITENIKHHIEEEEGDMFIKARDILSRSELLSLGDAMHQRREELRTVSSARS